MLYIQDITAQATAMGLRPRFQAPRRFDLLPTLAVLKADWLHTTAYLKADQGSLSAQSPRPQMHATFFCCENAYNDSNLP